MTEPSTLELTPAQLARGLADVEYVAVAGEEPGPPQVVAKARRFVEVIETAGAITLTGWDHLDTAELSRTLALLSHLNPRARVAPHVAGAPPRPATDPAAVSPGWVCCLNGEHDPWFDDPHVHTMRYRADRPFHPGRLLAAYDGAIGAGASGHVVRSAGLCQVATRIPRVGVWNHVGSMIDYEPTRLRAGEGGAPLGQDIGITGFDLDEAAIAALLDGCLLDDAELAAGPSHWRALPDELTPWAVDDR